MARPGAHIKTTYKVVGLTRYLGHEPGETFAADLDPEAERRAKARGQIKAVKATPKKEKEEKADG
jgi:hypothetical protein